MAPPLLYTKSGGDMKNSTKLQITLVAIFAFTGLMGCGPQKSGMTSGSDNSASTSNPDLANKTVAELNALGYLACTRDANNESDLLVRSMLYSDPFSGIVNHRYLRLKFERFPTNFTGTAANPAFGVFASTMSSDGAETPATPLKFGFEKHTNGFQALGPMTYQGASWADMVNIINYYQLGYTAGDTMMNNVTLIVDLAGFETVENLVIKVATYDTGLTLVKQVNLLAPTFLANPNQYNATHPAAANNLHPLRYMTGTTWTQGQYVAQTQQFCF
jgi:hypothetical protein